MTDPEGVPVRRSGEKFSHMFQDGENPDLIAKRLTASPQDGQR
jgi:hypothetical protein